MRYELRRRTHVKEVEREADLDMSEREEPNIRGDACQCRHTLTALMDQRFLDLLSCQQYQFSNGKSTGDINTSETISIEPLDAPLVLTHLVHEDELRQYKAL